MNWSRQSSLSKELQDALFTFIEQYGTIGLERALQLYTDLQQEYICKTKTSVSKIQIYDIYYLEILKHNITVHTQQGTYQKYGTLNNELKFLSPYGFVKCNQSYIVSLNKIRTVCSNYVILVNNEHLHMSRHYAPTVITAFRTRAPQNRCK